MLAPASVKSFKRNPIFLKPAGTRIQLVKSSPSTLRDDRGDVYDRIYAALVADEVHVAALIDESGSRPEDLGCAARIGCAVERQLAALHDHNAWAWMRVPA